MSANEHLWKVFWEDLDTEGRLLHIGWWAEKEPVQFDEAFDLFREQVLKASGYNPTNLWTMDESRQQVFCDWLESSHNISWEKYIDHAFNDYCSSGPEPEDYREDR